MSNPLVFNVDSDGVVYDWHGFMTPYLEEAFGKPVERWDTWDMAEQMGVTKKEFYKVFDQAVGDGCFRNGVAIPGAIEGLNTLIDAGHRVRIVTNKILSGVNKTHMAIVDMVTWYTWHDLTDKVEFVLTGSKWGKSGYPADVVIDDKPDLAWAQGYPTVNILFDQPWNQAGLGNVAEVGDSPNFEDFYLYRAKGWRDVLELAEQIGSYTILLDKSPVVI